MPDSYHSNSLLLTSLLNALIKCGDCSSAEILFATMKKSVESYGNLMSGFNQENTPLKTINLFNQMKRNGIERNMIIYLCVIKALAQLGDYETSQSIVEEIPDSYLLNDRIQTALVDMWVSSALIFYQSFFFSKKSFQGKTGNVDRAEEIFKKISQPGQVGYNAMSLFHFLVRGKHGMISHFVVNSYGLNGMGSQAIEVYRQMPKKYIDEATYVCVLNACSHSGLVDEARSIFTNIPTKNGKIYCTMVDKTKFWQGYFGSFSLIHSFRLIV